MVQLSDVTSTPTSAAETQALPGDGLREGIVAALRADLGQDLIDTHLVPQDDLWVRVAAESLAQAALMAQNPKLLRQIDESLVADAYDICVRHLGAIPAGYRRQSTIIGVASSIAFSLLAVAALVAVVLYWRGFL